MGSKIISETKNGTQTTRYIYNERGLLVGFEYLSKMYYYNRDLLGIITEIVDENKEVMVSYKYDAWGRLLNKVYTPNTIGEDIAELNSFIYKGYYLDEETGWYYLKSRFYSSSSMRFISADNCVDIQSKISINLFEYCFSNPITMIDDNGNLAFFLVTGLIGAVAGAVVGGIIAASKGQNIAAGAAIGAVAGGLLGMGAGALYAGFAAGSFTASTTTVFTGTKLMVAAYKIGGATSAGYMALDNISNAINQTQHVFWSGGELAKNEAAKFANTIGGKTLEMTRFGQYLESIPYNKALWNIASENFANQVSPYSQVDAFLNIPAMHEKAVWLTVELPKLAEKFVEIVKHILGG